MSAVHRRGVQSMARQTMTHRAVVTRLPRSGDNYTDPHGHPLPPGAPPNLLHASLPCKSWVVTTGNDGEVEDGDKTAVVHRVMLVVPADTDIREDDSVSEIRDRAGRMIMSGPLNVLLVTQKVDHVQVTTRRVV